MTILALSRTFMWESNEQRYRNGRLTFFGYDDAEFCANAWERQAYGGVGAGLPRKVFQQPLGFGDLVASPVRGNRGYEWSLQIRERGL